LVLVSVHVSPENKIAEGLLNNYSNSYGSKSRMDFGKKQFFETNPKPVCFRNYTGKEYFFGCGVSLVRLFYEQHKFFFVLFTAIENL